MSGKNVNKSEELYFIAKVESGWLKTFKNGKIKNNRTNRFAGYISNSGYLALAIKEKGKIHHILSHRLIYLIHKGKIPEGYEINHKNGIKADNRISNLEVVTPSENTIHSYKNGLQKSKPHSKKSKEHLSKLFSGENGSNAKLSNKDVIRIRKLHKNPYTAKQLSIKFGVGISTIGDIIWYRTFKKL